jgi:hypothetical protein
MINFDTKFFQRLNDWAKWTFVRSGISIEGDISLCKGCKWWKKSHYRSGISYINSRWATKLRWSYLPGIVAAGD